MYWQPTPPLGETMPLSPISDSTSMDTNESVNHGTSSHIITCSTPPPLNPNISLPLGHPCILTNERGAPPSYEEAIDPNAPPPSYDSLFGRVKEARKVVFLFLMNIIVLLLGTIGCSIAIGVSIGIPICMMIIGGLYYNDCPQEEYIPVYLFVGGAFSLLTHLLQLGARLLRLRQEEIEEARIRESPTQTLINCFMLGWFVIGSMWVYKEYEPNYDPALVSRSRMPWFRGPLLFVCILFNLKLKTVIQSITDSGKNHVYQRNMILSTDMGEVAMAPTEFVHFFVPEMHKRQFS